MIMLYSISRSGPYKTILNTCKKPLPSITAITLWA